MPARTRTPAADPAPEPEPARADPGGFFRNDGPGTLTVLGDGVTAVLAPGRIAALTRTPTHRDLQPATQTEFEAQQSADQAAPEEAPAAEPTTDETEA